MLGVPFGVTAKYWTNARDAVQAAFGVSDGNADFHVDALRHFDAVLPRSKEGGRIPLYAGLGVKLKSENRTFFGLRFVGGLACFLRNRPIELFMEVAPVLRLAPDEGAAVDGGVGARWYFGGP